MIRAPQGWWEAVTATSDRCLMVLTDRIDLDEDDATMTLERLRVAAARGAALSAVANVVRAYP